MIAWLLIQKNPTTGEENVTFVTEPVANIEDYAIRTASWKDCRVEIVGVNITALDPSYVGALTVLGNRTFRNDGFCDSEEAFTTTDPDKVTRALRALKDQYS